MDFSLNDRRGPDMVRIGMSCDDLRGRLGRYREFRRTTESPKADQFLDAGVMVTYGPNGQVTLLEFANPARVLVGRFNVMGAPLDSATGEISREFGIVAEPDDEGVRFPEWKLSLYAPDGLVEGLLLGE